MTVQSTQLLHLAEETSDLAQEGGLSKDGTDNIWDARYNKIKNLLDPTEPGDAVNLNYITKNQTSLLTQLRNTGATQNASIVATGDAQNARLTATGDNQNTRLTTTGDTQNKRLTDTGASYVTTMTTLKDTATTKASEASGSAELSKKWSMSAASPDGVSGNKSSKTWAEEAKTSASNAKISETNAKTSETNAKSSETKASTSEGNAKTSETNAKISETNAKNSATLSATSAANAKTSETNAKSAATNAADSEKKAKTYVDTLKNPVADVKGSNGKVLVTKVDGSTSKFDAGLNILTRSKAYSVGDIAYSPKLPSWAYLECTTAGTTGASEPDFSSVKSGGVILDGEAKFTIRTVCAKEYVDALRESDEVVKVPITNLVGTNYITAISCQKSGHVVQVHFRPMKIVNANSDGRNNIVLKGFPKPIRNIDMICPSMNTRSVIRGILYTDGSYGWQWMDNWNSGAGTECAVNFTYLTKD